MIAHRALLVALLVLAQVLGAQTARPPVIVASKPFGESYLLAEIVAQWLEANAIAVARRPGIGGTSIAFGALQRDAIDVYPEYTGSGLDVILGDTLVDSLRASPAAVYAHVVRQSRARFGVQWLPPLGFENSYAIAVTRTTAARYALRTIGDLTRVPRLRAGFTADFIGLPDGLPALTRMYALRPVETRPLAPAIKYQALADGRVDVIDGYTTDGLLARYPLIVLADDRHVFPPYEAALILGPRAARTRPDVVAVLTQLSGRIDTPTMQRWNGRIEVDGEPVGRVATAALRELGLVAPGASTAPVATTTSSGFLPFLWERRSTLLSQLWRHCWLVTIALLAAVAVALPLGLLLERAQRIAAPLLGALAVVQTIPSIALLAFMLPLFGIGIVPALIALWLYALYPIARATYTGVRGSDRAALDAAQALGATPMQQLRWIRLPLAMPVIMSGIRTAAVITVGAATLAAFIGASGLGEPIVSGLALADSRMVLSGALPAALLAVVVDAVLGAIAHRLRPPSS
jgi:osmoprotectant transport system permease protein